MLRGRAGDKSLRRIAMFGRRTPHRLSKKFTEAVWPSMGLKRATRYWRHRVVRLQDTNFSIAAGLATGAAISFTPLPGIHLLMAVALCFMMRVSLLGGALGTFLGNPWTFPVMWWMSYKVGEWAFVLLGYQVHTMPAQFEWMELMGEIIHDPMRLFLPWFVGGLILLFLSWPVFYLIFHWMIRHLRSTHHHWRDHRLHKGLDNIKEEQE